MKILVGRVYEGERRVTVVPRWGARMSPIQVRGRDEEAVAAELLTVLQAVELRERAPARAAPASSD